MKLDVNSVSRPHFGKRRAAQAEKENLVCVSLTRSGHRKLGLPRLETDRLDAASRKAAVFICGNDYGGLCRHLRGNGDGDLSIG